VKVTTTDADLRHGLVITDVQLSDAGQYVVRMSDHNDQSSLVESSVATLTVIPRRPTTDGTHCPVHSSKSNQTSTAKINTQQ